MTSILKNITRLGLISIYPLIIFLCGYFILRKRKYHNSIKKHYKQIILNTLIITTILSIIIFVFFKFEDTIYSYDYAGHWIRSLRLRELFFNDPYAILPSVYKSMLYDDYSSLPALFNLVSIIINTSYGFFALSTMIVFLVPSFILLQILYFTYLDGKWWLPSLITLTFYPLYITIFNGEIDLVGIFFVLMTLALIIIPNFEDIDWVDNLSFNLFGFLMIFLRRWYLYPLVGLYLAYFIKYLSYYHLHIWNRDALKKFGKIICSGLILLLVILIGFFPFFLKVIGNNYSEAYQYYNRDYKIYNLINFYSPIVLMICIYGAYNLYKKYNKKLLLLNICVMLIVPTLMFWHIQSFEYHHYNIINTQIILLYGLGIFALYQHKQRILPMVTSCLLLIQTSIIFTNVPQTMPLLTNIRKTPEILDNKQQIIDFTYYLNSIMPEDWQSAYLSSSSSLLNDDMIRNSILPDIHAPNIDTAIFDLRDGFPKDLEYVQFIITIDPIQYLDSEYQHIFEIITNAVQNESNIKALYQPINTAQIGDLKLTVYEKIGEWTQETKEYFYNEMLKYYPDKADFFAYILD